MHVCRNSEGIHYTQMNAKVFHYIFIAGFWSMISKTKSIPEDSRKSPLAVQSLLLLLALSSHSKQEDGNYNPFRDSLFQLGAEESDGNYLLLILSVF